MFVIELLLFMNIESLHSNQLQRMGMVKPVVMVHAVSISTGSFLILVYYLNKLGYYIKSKGLPFAPPVASKYCNINITNMFIICIMSRSCFLKDTYSIPYWDQDLVIDAFFR